MRVALPRKERRRCLEDLVGAPQLPVLALEFLDPLRLGARHAGPRAAVDLGLAHPLAHRLGRRAELLGDEQIGCHPLAYSSRCSSTILTARSRTSRGNLVPLAISAHPLRAVSRKPRRFNVPQAGRGRRSPWKARTKSSNSLPLPWRALATSLLTLKVDGGARERSSDARGCAHRRHLDERVELITTPSTDLVSVRT